MSALLGELVLLLLLSVAAGLVGALLGIGGGIFLVPALTLLLDIDIRIAAATSLIAVIVTSSTSASSYLHEGFVNVSLGMFLEVFTTIGAVASAIVVVFLSPSVIEVVFGFILIYGAVYMRISKETSYSVSNSEEKQQGLSGRFVSCCEDKSTGETVRYKVRHVRRGAAASFLAGNISGLIGIGGGIVKVPVMNVWMGVPMKAACATSNFMIGVTAVASALVYLSNGFVAPVLTAIVALGVFVGAFFGSRALPRVRSARLRGGFAVALALIAALMFMRAAGWLA